MSQIRFTEDHEWVSVLDDHASVGITAHAAEQLGDVVFVELPEIGQIVEKGKTLATVESVKAASEVYAPVSGEVVSVNETLEDEPGKVNESPQDQGWFVKLKLLQSSEINTLMDEAAYTAFID